MTEKEPKTVETVSKEEFDKVSTELAQTQASLTKANTAIQKLISAMAQRYAQDLYKEVMSD